ncbi:M66 family metalloprotease [Andreprevotia chitinilytica]|uniref:M66 family metalloprotease n=1 Tax=Andreprevotia chitinilytica TaxID=396808 RepID=UPI0009FC2651|nr:M66 family metalloprotease [Andreprevotia chitinilytica]
MRYSRPRHALSALLCSLSLIAGCGGGGGGNGSDSGGSTSSTVSLSKVEFAQTHVVPENGLSWTLPNTTGRLNLIGNRDALALIAIAQADVQKPTLEAWQGSTKVGSIALNPPSALPPSESAGPAYATDRWSAVVPGAWLAPGVSIKVSSSNYTTSVAHALNVGADSTMNLYVLPFYLFGANDSNTQPYATTKAPDAATQLEMFAKWPAASLNVQTHAIGRVNWPSLVVGPRADSNSVNQPAYAVTSMDQQKDGFGVMSAVLSLIQSIRAANGDGGTDNQYYAPILAIDTASGKYHDPGGGLGGGNAGVGDYRYSGIFIHEQGHAYGLPHAGEAYAVGKFPYVGGSLNGSAWGYDVNRKEFLSPLVPSTASSYNSCKSGHQLNASGNCYKQDPMQGGAGDQSPGYKFATFADFNAGKMQEWFEGNTTTDTNGVHSYSGGVMYVDAKSATGYSRWDTLSRQRVPVQVATTSGGIWGLNQGLPVQTGVPVYSIAITYSYAGTAGVSQIYPPLQYTGNLLQNFDPSSAQDLSDFKIDTGKYYWYCKGSGCDYTVRVTYADNSQIYRVLQGGFRSWFAPTAAIPATASDPLNGGSFKSWVINVPGSKAISKIELLNTPMVWLGLPASPTVLLSR